ncbi:EF-hand domain-containing protein [Jannaschia sp. Os4]|uniref:EF-hand domain-containing protein n=1 Tax=Jannaschia sp. Os4 TaxID=2807617 RepID=UPI0019398F82|nr:EF-hand domain-containing protein [Jannaschia sp. Os4]MBM2576860.1 EF-hand domain-containing protein [Jannaschia sp. Os4]
MRPTLARAATCLALLAAPAAAAPGFAAVDRDADHAIDWAEFEAVGGRPDAFARLDADGDGFVSRAELLVSAGRAAPTPRQIDIDGNGILAAWEMRHHFGRAFDRAMRAGAWSGPRRYGPARPATTVATGAPHVCAPPLPDRTDLLARTDPPATRPRPRPART